MSTVLLVSATARMGGAERSLAELARALDGSRWGLVAALGEEGPLADALAGAGARVEIARMSRLRRTADPLQLAGHVRALASARKELVRIVSPLDLAHNS